MNVWKKAEIIHKTITCPVLYMDSRGRVLLRDALAKIPAKMLRQCVVESHSKDVCMGIRIYPSLRFLPLIALDLFPGYFDETTAELILAASRKED